MDLFVPKAGQGPSKKQRENGFFNLKFYFNNGQQRYIAKVTGDMDPGYGSTSKMITESAVCLVKECDDLKGGIYTSASSMGTKLIKRLEDNAGLIFKLE